MASPSPASPEFIDRTVDFPDGATYNLLHPLTDYRACHVGTPLEARILYMCKRSESDGDQEFVMKVKVQYVILSLSPRWNTYENTNAKFRLPGDSETDQQTPEKGPSTTTALELKALAIFRTANSKYAPQLLGFKRAVQGNNCPLPGGYLTYTLMNKVPGESLFQLHYWILPEEEQQDITERFLEALRYAFLNSVRFSCNLPLTSLPGQYTSSAFSLKTEG